jgi:aminoglycoside 6'-N-acetyltransferase
MTSRISFRPLCRSDFPLLQRWLAEPHVKAWWGAPLDLAGVHAHYGPRVDRIEPTHVFVIEHDGRPAGWIQWYRWSNYQEHALQLEAEPDSAGIDLAIGEQEMMGLGLGPLAISEFLKEIVFVDPGIIAVITDPHEDNLRSVLAFEKAGFSVTKTVQIRGESFRRRVVRLDHPKQINDPSLGNGLAQSLRRIRSRRRCTLITHLWHPGTLCEPDLLSVSRSSDWRGLCHRAKAALSARDDRS